MKLNGFEISHPDKILFPEIPITKEGVVRYYEEVADDMLPYLKDRPITLHRFPNGVDKPGFYQKNISEYFPDYIQTIKVPTKEGENIQIICNTKKALLYLANQGTIGFHTWLSKKDKLDKPDKIVFDLDPSDNDFEKVKVAAKLLKKFLLKKGFEPSLMTTGQHGLHLFFPVRRTKTFDQVKAETKALAEEIEKAHPDIFTTAFHKDKREGKIFIDYLRNEYAQTSVCPYSLRPNDVGGIAFPISWEELNKIPSANHFNLKNFKK